MDNFLELLEFHNIIIGVFMFYVMFRVFERIQQRKLGYDNFEFAIYKSYYRFLKDKKYEDWIANKHAIENTEKYLIKWEKNGET